MRLSSIPRLNSDNSNQGSEKINLRLNNSVMKTRSKHNSQLYGRDYYQEGFPNKNYFLKSTFDSMKPITNLNVSERLNPKIKVFSRFHIPRKQSLTENTCDLQYITVFPISNKTALTKFSDQLTDYEKEEIKYYHLIYYIGIKSQKCNHPALFDDEDFNYRANQLDHLIYRYEIFQVLGKGAFGVTYKCFDHKLKQYFAVKIIKHTKNSERQSDSEIYILKTIKNNKNSNDIGIVNIIDSFKFRNHTCIVFELLDLSLFQHFKLNNRRGFPIEVVKSFLKSLLNSLCFLKSLNIIHCDLKPANILFSSDASNCLKIIDFGTSCMNAKPEYLYIQSRYYRAPEILLGLEFNEKIDVWSLGCIGYELATGNVLFKGENEVEMLKLISMTIGKPPNSVIEKIKKNKIHFNSKKEGIFPRINDKSLAEFLDSKLYLECLVWDPNQRISPIEGLQHICFHGINKI